MVTVANCYDLQEALRLQMALGAADIPSFIPDEATAQNAPYFFVGSGAGVRLQVAGEHVSEAQRIIATARGENDLVAVRRRPPKGFERLFAGDTDKPSQCARSYCFGYSLPYLSEQNPMDSHGMLSCRDPF
jgi:hypothetical protein